MQPFGGGLASSTGGAQQTPSQQEFVSQSLGSQPVGETEASFPWGGMTLPPSAPWGSVTLPLSSPPA